jgi:putative transposon-encoded protein
MRKIKLHKGNFTLEDEVIGFIEKRVTKFGSGAKVDCPKRFLGKRVYILVCKDDAWDSEETSETE